MRGLVYRAPGVVETSSLPEPKVQPHEVLIRVSHVGLCGTDRLVASGGFERVRAPRIIGHEFGGVVEESPDSGIPCGTSVAVEPTLPCGDCETCRRGAFNACQSLRFFGIDIDGGAAEFVAVPEKQIHVFAETTPDWARSLAEPIAVATHMTRRANLAPQDRILIVGGGPIGALIALVARMMGNSDVVIVEADSSRRELLDSSGLTAVDPGCGVISQALEAADFDVAFEVAGAAGLMEQLPDLVRPRGTIIAGSLTQNAVPVALSRLMLREQRIIGSRAYETTDFAHAVHLLNEFAPAFSWIVGQSISLEDTAEIHQALFGRPTGLKTLIQPHMSSH